MSHESAARSVIPVLTVLQKCSPNTYKSLLRDKQFQKGILKAFREIAHNYLHNENLALSAQDKRKVKKFRKLLEKLASPKATVNLLVRNQKCAQSFLLAHFLDKHATI